MKKRKTTDTRQHRRKRAGKKIFPQFVGKVQMTREGFIFVIVDGQDDDIFVKASKTRHALDGDKVRVAVTKAAKAGRGGRQDSRREGEVVEIIERSRRPFVGVYHTVGAQGWVLMQSRSMPYDIRVDVEQAAEMGAQKGMKVTAVVDGWERGEVTPAGHITDVLGEIGANETEMHAILAEFGLPYRFEPEVENAADAISEEITPDDLKGRKDFRDTLTFTIDPADAKDFDDALSFKPLQNGNYEVGVHIADVSWYVRPGSPVDKEARERGTSVYLVDRTVPMLPEKLCNKLCSLRQGEDKLTFSAVFEITPKAEIKSRWLGRTVIRSDARLDYGQAQQIIDEAASGSAPVAPAEHLSRHLSEETERRVGDPAEPLSGHLSEETERRDGASLTAQGLLPELRKAITTLNTLAGKLKKKRFKAGAIDFDRPEMKVEVDSEGKPVKVYQKFSTEANFLIEEFMLLANRTVAEFVATGGKMNALQAKNAKTFVYRVHGEPNDEKLASLKVFAGTFGYKMEDFGEGRSAATSLSTLLHSAKGKPEFGAFENLALRAMAKAVYSTDNIGHYGLAFKFYTHFTSPIRRYPDLMVHRLLASYLQNGESANADKMQQECLHASEREVLAADAERTSVKYKVVEFMQDKVGQEMEGCISGITEWGMYVEVDETHIEGMVPLREIHSDFYDFDEEHYRLVGRRTHKVFRLGDRVRIKVAATNLEQRLLDYELVEEKKTAQP